MISQQENKHILKNIRKKMVHKNFKHVIILAIVCNWGQVDYQDFSMQ